MLCLRPLGSTSQHFPLVTPDLQPLLETVWMWPPWAGRGQCRGVAAAPQCHRGMVPGTADLLTAAALSTKRMTCWCGKQTRSFSNLWRAACQHLEGTCVSDQISPVQLYHTRGKGSSSLAGLSFSLLDTKIPWEWQNPQHRLHTEFPKGLTVLFFTPQSCVSMNLSGGLYPWGVVLLLQDPGLALFASEIL